jgi:hypothetical protein
MNLAKQQFLLYSQRLKYFIGKPVTIFTNNIGRNFTEVQYNDYFTGICKAIDGDGVETVHPITNCKNFFFFNNIIGICEEQQLDPNNPDHQKVIKEINGKKEDPKEDPKELPLMKSESIDINLLNKLIEK